MNFNRRHRHSGYLFQNRYKSILCQKEPYIIELVRYIHQNPLRAKGDDLDKIARRESQVLNMPKDQVWSKGKCRYVVAARSLLFLADRELGMSATFLTPMFNVSATAISKSDLRGEAIARGNGFEL